MHYVCKNILLLKQCLWRCATKLQGSIFTHSAYTGVMSMFTHLWHWLASCFGHPLSTLYTAGNLSMSLLMVLLLFWRATHYCEYVRKNFCRTQLLRFFVRAIHYQFVKTVLHMWSPRWLQSIYRTLTLMDVLIKYSMFGLSVYFLNGKNMRIWPSDCLHWLFRSVSLT